MESKHISYEVTSANDEPAPRFPANGLPGKLLFRLEKGILLYLLIVAAYACGALGLAGYLATCPWEVSAIKVLKLNGWKVDQFYSSLGLSILLTPAAIIIRRIAVDLALLHPFAIASKQHVKVKDLDRFMNPGLSAAYQLFKYSVFAGVVQVLLLIVGSTLVPVGTLLVYTGTYSAPLFGTAFVGMPTATSNIMTMDVEMESDFSGASLEDIISGDNFFADHAIDIFRGDVIRSTGVVNPTSTVLGPVATTNLTYQEGVRYDGIVTYEWLSGCQYTDVITFTQTSTSDEWLYNISFPNGHGALNQDAWESKLIMQNSTSNDSIQTYYATIGTIQETVNMDEAIAEGAVTVSNGSWISLVQCQPFLSWTVSSCLWQNNSVTDCYDAPGTNTTALDDVGLNELNTFLSAVPLIIQDDDTYTYGLETLQTALMLDSKGTNDHQYRAPILSDFDNLYGMVAQALAEVTTAGYYGTAEVPTTGSPAQAVYLVRTYVLAILIGMLVLCPLLTVALLFLNLQRHMPLRRATFLTVANAVRGPRWDAILTGGCVMPHNDLKESFSDIRVMYGVDQELGHHVGLAESVTPVQRNSLYVGVENM